jgi:sigma-B regulation protein RsbU (phosphoserine phosphatase)
MALLQVIRGLTPGQQFPLEGERAVLGRHPECDIVLDVGAVSRQHAQILRVNNEYYVEDLESRNGTFVNGQVITGRRRLEENDRVKICDLLFTFHVQQPDDAGPHPRAISDTSPSSSAMMVDDPTTAGTTIMSSIDIQASRNGLQVGANAEVKLKALLEITRNLGTTISLEHVLRRLLDSLFKIFVQADRGFVVLKSERGELIPKAVKHRRHDNDDTIRISRTIVNQVMASGEAILSADAASDVRFDTSQSIADFRIRSMMCAPLVDSEGTSLGVIQIDTLDQRSRFQQDDLDVLASVACQAAIAMENAQLHETALSTQAYERDLDLAHKVQQGILPSQPPQVSGYKFFDFYEPANQVGGDYYDYVHLPGDRLGVIVADVSGKGIPAALLMAKLSAEARYTLVSEATPADALNRLNCSLNRGGWEDRFVTMVVAVIDLATHEVTVANAGHMAPILRRGKRVEFIGSEETGVPLGVDNDARYRQCRTKIAAGDLFTLYTDGISEAMNPENELYGIARLKKLLAAEKSGVDQLGKRILEDVKHFVGSRPQSDDMCLICFERAKA